MALVNCSECNNKVSTEALNCPKCGAKIDLQKIEEKKKKTTNGCLIFCAAIFAFSVIVGMINSNNDTISTTSSQTEEDKSLEAYVYSQQVVEQNLKSPGSAEFPSFSTISVVKNGNQYTINAHVDAQNSFGANLRSTYTCVLLENNNLYTVESININ